MKQILLISALNVNKGNLIEARKKAKEATFQLVFSFSYTQQIGCRRCIKTKKRWIRVILHLPKEKKKAKDIKRWKLSRCRVTLHTSCNSAKKKKTTLYTKGVVAYIFCRRPSVKAAFFCRRPSVKAASFLSMVPIFIASLTFFI